MKNFLVLLFYISSLIQPIPAFAQVGVVEGFYAKNISAPTNYTLNSSCSINTKDVVASQAGTLTRRTSGGLLDGKDCAFDATALGQTVKWNLKQYDTALKNQMCMTSFTYQYAGASSDYRAYVERGGVEIPNTSVLLQATGTDVREQSIYHPCGDLTQATKPVIVSAVANPGPIYAVFMDSKKSNQQTIIDAPEWVGSVTYATTTTFSTASTTFVSATTAGAKTYTGRIIDIGGSQVGFRIPTMLPGLYVMTMSGANIATGGGASPTNSFGYASFSYSELPINDQCGSLIGGGNEVSVHDASSAASFSCTYVANSTLTNKDFSIKFRTNISNAQFNIAGNTRIDVYRYPTINSSAQSIGLPEAVQYVGEVFPVATSTCPAGSLIANGATVSRTAESELFAAIGVTHGQGDGSTTFHLPDYRGRFLRGVDGGTGRDPNAASRTTMNAGGNTGNAVGSVQGQATAKNGLALTDPGHSHNFLHDATSLATVPLDGAANTGDFNRLANGGAGTFSNLTLQSNTTGVTLGAGDAETRPINAYVNYCIRTKTTRLTANLLTGNEITEVAADYSPLITDNHIRVDASGAARTITLPSAATLKGKIYEITNSAFANQVIVTSTSGTVCGQSSVRLSATNDSIRLQSNGTNWIGLNNSCYVTYRFFLTTPNTGVSHDGFLASVSTSGNQGVLNFKTGTWSVSPSCTWSCSSDYVRTNGAVANNTSTFLVGCSDSSGTQLGSRLLMGMCYGSR